MFCTVQWIPHQISYTAQTLLINLDVEREGYSSFSWSGGCLQRSMWWHKRWQELKITSCLPRTHLWTLSAQGLLLKKRSQKGCVCLCVCEPSLRSVRGLTEHTSRVLVATQGL